MYLLNPDKLIWYKKLKKIMENIQELSGRVLA